MNNYLKYYKQLNRQQALAVDTIEGPVLVLAGPGTGKTQLLSVRAASILDKRKIQPENILILTYTNFAAKAMKERLARIVGLKGYDVGVFTFHSFANSIIQESEEAIDYIQNRIQITDVERTRAIEYILDNASGVEAIRPFGSPYIYQNEILNNRRDLKNAGVSPEVFARFIENLKHDDIYIQEKHLPRLRAFAIVFAMYEDLKRGGDRTLFDERGRYDYEDMIIVAKEALKKEEALREKYQSQYAYIMVDEFQDTNGAQLELLFTLADRQDSNLACVGDDDQAIYRFQGASVGNFRLLRERFKKLKVISLIDNYRSTEEVIDLSRRIIDQIPLSERLEDKDLVPKKDYKGKNIEFAEFTTEDEELIFIVNKIRQLKDKVETSRELTEGDRAAPYNNIAILVRRRAYILKIVDALLRAGIPYATDGREDIRGEKRVRQMLDVLELARIKTEEDRARGLTLYKVLAADYFGMAHSDILRFIRYANSKRRIHRKEIDEGQAESTHSLFGEFLSKFPADPDEPPRPGDTGKLAILKEIELENPEAMHRASWAIHRLISEAHDRPVHDILMQFIKDARIYHHILDTYDEERVLRMRELRGLTSFVNMVKNSDLSRPGIGLDQFMEEIELQKAHDMPLVGELVTATQDGVRVYTAHGSKGLEFHSVIIPFCLQDKSWPLRPRGEMLPLPPGVFRTKEKIDDRVALKRLKFYDETRLFYVAASRTKANLIITASPSEKSVLSPYAGALGVQKQEFKGEDEEKVLVDFLSKTNKREPFIGTDKVLADIARDTVMTPTKLNNYIRCRRKFLYDNVLRLPGPKKQSLVFGNCAHRALEVTFEAYMKTGNFPDVDYFVREFNRELDLQGVSASARTGCSQKLERLKAWFEKESRNPTLPVGLEKKLIANVGDGILFVGKYDKMELVGGSGKTARVVDYKTGTPDKHIKKLMGSRDLASEECDDYLRQLVAYKLLFEKDKTCQEGHKVNRGMLVFLEPMRENNKKYDLRKDGFRNEDIEITDDMVKELEKVIVGCWKGIQALRFDRLPERDGEKCTHCDFDEICWSK